MKHRLSMAVTLAAVAATGVGLSSPTLAVGAPADPAVTSVEVSANPADNTPDVLDGKVNAIVQLGSTVYVGGNFTQVQAQGGAVVAQPALFAFDATTGQLNPAFAVALPKGTVNDIVPSADGASLYIGGSFQNFNGARASKNVVRVNAVTGAVMATFKSPQPDGGVTDLNMVGNTLYIGGLFTTVNGAPRQFVAALDASTGADTGTLKAAFSGVWDGGVTDFRGMDVSPDGQSLVVLGNFTSVNGLWHPQVARFSLSTTGGAAALSDWMAPQLGITCNFPDQHVAVRDVDFDPTGTYFVIASSGGSPLGFSTGNLCDSATRWETAGSGASVAPTWVDYTGGDTLTRVLVTSSAVYVGGHQHGMNNIYGNSSLGIGGTPRKGIAALDPRNGLPLRWNPQRAPGYGVSEFTMTDAGLWMGHDTEVVGGETHKRLALFPLAGGKAPLNDATRNLPGRVFVLGAHDVNVAATDTVSARSLSAAGAVGAITDPGNAGRSWSASGPSFMVGNLLYTMAANGTLSYSTYDGTKLGAPTAVDMAGHADLVAQIPLIRSAFFDATTGRLYYTFGSHSGLYYRDFEPETNTFGFRLVNVQADTADIGWGQVDGAFLANGKLFYVTADGALHSITWTGGITVPGTATTLSGPAVDGRSWLGKGLVVLP